MGQPGLMDATPTNGNNCYPDEDDLGIYKCKTCRLTDCYSYGGYGSCAETKDGLGTGYRKCD